MNISHIYNNHGGCHLPHKNGAAGGVPQEDREQIRQFIPLLCAVFMSLLTALTLPSILYSTESVISAVCGFAVALILGIKQKGLIVVGVCGVCDGVRG